MREFINNCENSLISDPSEKWGDKAKNNQRRGEKNCSQSETGVKKPDQWEKNLQPVREEEGKFRH